MAMTIWRQPHTNCLMDPVSLIVKTSTQFPSFFFWQILLTVLLGLHIVYLAYFWGWFRAWFVMVFKVESASGSRINHSETTTHGSVTAAGFKRRLRKHYWKVSSKSNYCTKDYLVCYITLPYPELTWPGIQCCGSGMFTPDSGSKNSN